ncbi:Na+/H+ antiporter subunit E [Arthrobacter echini]|uniref:Na+/H+ antiporter subunit E n=1 Tax=Arthrobacter echini TaxID=1529066 RepID=A0A4S5EA22_9MICC|nr:Na+/H+ antiporter subunit E [Arthrobacter echini]THJ68504.1 Na+/H+ antiporter subunit E [Arthrobacter echini]
MSRQKFSLVTDIPLIIWLTLVWSALWQDFGPGTLIPGFIIAIVVVNFFYLPPVGLSGRFNVLSLIAFSGRFLVDLVTASFEVFWLAISKGPDLRNAVVAVRLRTRSDLILTATGHVTSLVPGSFVLEVDRGSSTLYLHCLNIVTPKDADAVRASVLRSEAGLIRIMGTRKELDELRAEESTP